MYRVRPDILTVSKALGEETRFAIFQAVAEAETPLTVKDLVARFGMHHSAIRIHLNRLEEAGLIFSRRQHQKGAVGRPQLAFLPSETALNISLPPRNYEFLARLAIDFMTRETDGAREAEAFGHEWGREYIRSTAHGIDGPLPLEDALTVLREEALRLGGRLEIAGLDGRGFALLERNCIFGELSPKYEPLVCDLHQSVMRGMLAELTGDAFRWESASTLARGDDRCLVRISPAA